MDESEHASMIETILWTDAGVVMIDQTRLPREEVYVTCTSYQQVAEAIRSMVIRGAPAIGVAAAMGVALGMQSAQTEDDFEQICSTLANTRPTAVNLFWALDRMRTKYRALSGRPLAEVREALVKEAKQIRLEDIAINECIGRNGAPLVPDGKVVLTHCNAGALATAGYGTALGVIRAAVADGKKIEVYADETRPFLQGARLTVWELQHDGIPATLITDSMAGHFLKSGKIGCVVVGADRIAANGDVANKIGTYSVAVLARENNVPFYVAAPVSTLDLTLASGDEIPIEQRAASEVTHVFGVPVAPENTMVQNPAFDVTPHRYVTAIITERGVARSPFVESLRTLGEECF
ncbi:MAG TPA: S-methyl-5-thioribose-1-phosphate isomerase [Bryobacteraceae bacterium]|nr:S-methyl-5-thioribose-1-phosphate isomerase [Bryobacteraceae bacterium]